MGEEGGDEGGENQLIMSNTYTIVLHTFGQKRNNKKIFYTVLLVDTFSLSKSYSKQVIYLSLMQKLLLHSLGMNLKLKCLK
jgi:hypothetical protein